LGTSPRFARGTPEPVPTFFDNFLTELIAEFDFLPRKNGTSVEEIV
jgi:hypothetical protein